VATNRNHLELPTFIDPEDPTYVFIRTTVGKTFSRLGLGGETDEKKSCLRVLERAHYNQRATFEAVPLPAPGVCDWIFVTSQMKGWLQHRHGNLLLEGSPGSGKTVLAKHIARQLPLTLQTQATLVLYHFFSWRGPEPVLY